jgi:hypothetical protein
MKPYLFAAITPFALIAAFALALLPAELLNNGMTSAGIPKDLRYAFIAGMQTVLGFLGYAYVMAKVAQWMSLNREKAGAIAFWMALVLFAVVFGFITLVWLVYGAGMGPEVFYVVTQIGLLAILFHRFRPALGIDRTDSAVRQTSGIEGLLSGAKRTCWPTTQGVRN